MASVAKWGGEAFVRAGAGNSVVRALADGRYVVGYDDLDNATSTGVFFRIFGAGGTAVGATHTRVNANTTNYQNWSDITALDNGGFVVAWEDSSSTFGDAMYRVFSATGGTTGNDLVANTTTDFGQGSLSITKLTNGNFVIAYNDQSDIDAVARAQLFSPTGAKIGTEFILNSATADLPDLAPTITALTNGSFVALWDDESNSLGDNSSGAIHGRVFTGDSTNTGGVQFQVNTTTNGSQASATVVALAAGKFMVVWVDDQDPRFNEAGNLVFSTIKAQLFNADGSKPAGSSELAISTNTTGNQSMPATATLKDGRVVIVWTDGSGSVVTGNYDSKITAAIYNANGTVSVAPFAVSTTSDGQQSDPSVTVLSDGRIVFSWQADNAGASSGVYTQMFDPRLAAIDIDGSNTLGDQLYGTAFADIIESLGGADLLFGAGHNDTMRGGDGNDTLNGDAGNDSLYGGNSDDRLNGGAGLDRLSGDAGIDTLYGGTEDDILSGGDGDDKLYGDAGADSVSGGNHNDTLTGGDGNDTLNGGTGNDSLLGGNHNDTLYGSDGNDTLSGDAGVDSLVGGNQNDSLLGGDSNDVLKGEAGTDTLSGGNQNDTLTGGLGVDKLTGGANDDRFVFTVAADSGVGVGLRDIITDFNLASTFEKIDLSALAAAAIVWRGTSAFTTTAAAEVRYKFEGSGTAKKTIIEVDLDSDVAAEMQIELSGNHFALTSGEFLL